MGLAQRPAGGPKPNGAVATWRSVDRKEGKTGPLVFVTVDHALYQDGRLCVQEEQNIVYREAPAGPGPLPPGEPAPAAAAWTRTLLPDAPLLFRFSALTFNGHRIHYDRDYATQVEFYPALVVHGPLLATQLLDLAQRQQPGAAITRFEFRALRPAFDTGALQLCGQPEPFGASLWTCDAQGLVGMSASAHFS